MATEREFDSIIAWLSSLEKRIEDLTKRVDEISNRVDGFQPREVTLSEHTDLQLSVPVQQLKAQITMELREQIVDLISTLHTPDGDDLIREYRESITTRQGLIGDSNSKRRELGPHTELLSSYK